MSSGKSSGGSGSSWSYNNTTLPDWVTNASQQAVSLGEQVASTPVPVYSGDRVADTNQDTLQAYQQIRDLQGSTNAAFDTAQGIYGNLSQGAQLLTPEQQNQISQSLMGGYQSNVINPAQGLLSPYIGQGPATAEQVAQNALTIMSPYSQAVINPALKIGQQQLEQNLRTIGSAANQAGAFGGSRQGVQEGVAQSQAALGAGQYVGDLLNKGWTSALTPAQAIALQGGQQGYNAANTLAGLYGTGYQGAQGAAQNIMNQNLATGMTATAAGPALALQQSAQAQKEASMLQTIGAAQQNQTQNELNDAMSQYYEAYNEPYTRAAALSSILSSVPYGSTTTSYGQSNSSSSKNTAGSVLGGAATGASIGSLFGPGYGTAIGAVAGGILGTQLMPIENLWGLLGSSGAGAANLAGTINDPNLGPTGWSSSGEAQWNPSTSSDWKWPSSKELAETLKGAGKSSGSSSSADDSIKGSSMIGSAGIHGGSGGISSDTVYKMLMARATPTVGQQKQGLLGV